MAATPPTSPVDAAFDQLIHDMKDHALEHSADYERVLPYLAKIRDMRARFSAGQPVNPARPKPGTIAEAAANWQANNGGAGPDAG